MRAFRWTTDEKHLTGIFITGISMSDQQPELKLPIILKADPLIKNSAVADISVNFLLA